MTSDLVTAVDRAGCRPVGEDAVEPAWQLPESQRPFGGTVADGVEQFVRHRHHRRTLPYPFGMTL
jgi:hypothetical protein